MEYSVNIGLETHVELSTESKIFCSCKNQFGARPNTNCCPVCLGLPGSLPRLNRQAVEFGIRAGLAMNCHISKYSQMARKNYVYPDLAKAYQISQSEYPLCYNGYIMLKSGKKIRINRIHIEEDAGKLIHDKNDIYIDYNRGGVPLIEIVTEPDFECSADVHEYLEYLRILVRYIKISDCKMQEGSMRCDVNVSVRESTSNILGERCEIKNMNSINNIDRAIEYESRRQIEIIKGGNSIIKQTMRYNDEKNVTEVMRSKESAEDYRYFAEPDLKMIYVSDKEIEKIRQSLPELPYEKLYRYMAKYGINEADAMQIIKHYSLASYFEKMVLNSCNPSLCKDIMLTHIFRFLPDEASKEECKILAKPEYISEVVNMISKGKFQNNFTKKIISQIMVSGKPFSELFSMSDFYKLGSDALLDTVTRIINENEKIINDFKSGKDKALGALIGLVMKETDGRASPEEARKMIMEKI